MIKLLVPSPVSQVPNLKKVITMKRIIPNKLVRDRIPEIISAAGKAFSTGILSEDDYLEMLNAKLNEEVAEYQASFEIEELADILEVVYAIAQAKGVSREDLEAVRLAKAEKRGAFEKRILLVDVVDEV